MTAAHQERPLWGKFRGRVVDNVDPLELGRLRVEVPQVPGLLATWALPCVPYAGPQVGFCFTPPIAGNVWVEFEQGNANYPIWVGCFWSELERPTEAADPLIKLIQTPASTFMLNDTPEVGGATLNTRDPAVDVPATLSMDSAGIQLTVEPATLSMSPEEGITAEFPPNTLSMTEAGITANSGDAIVLDAGADLTMNAGAAAELSAGGDVSIQATGAAEMTAGGDVAVSGGGAAELSGGGDASVSAGGAASIEAGGAVSAAAGGIVDIEAVGDIAITALAAEITAAGIAMTGAVEVTGDLLIDGQQPLVI